MANPENLANSFLPQVNHNPDVLSCLANLSNDEVFTPPNVANAMLDMLPQGLFSNPEAKFLDPVCKSGVFLREITKRLMQGLETEFPDMQKRLDHILHNQVYGIAITELTSLLSRRTLYCAKYPNCPFSISHFDNITGNIRYKNIRHTWKNGKCVFCGVSQAQYEREEGLETHAYEFIHTDNPQEIFGDMKFDVIIGNPPYQMNDGGGKGASAKAIYKYFINTAKKLNPQFISMIIPSRWYSGGKGLDDFRDEMLKDKHIKKLIDYFDTSDCFPGIDISGGICYFLWNKSHTDDCEITNNLNNTISVLMRPLLENHTNTFIRFNEAISILHKINYDNENKFFDIVSVRNPFAINCNVILSEKSIDRVKCYAYPKNGYITSDNILKNKEFINQIKIFISKAFGERGKFPYQVLPKPFIGEKMSCCSETYLLINCNNNRDIAKNILSYIQTKFFRFLVLLKKNTQNAPKNVYELVPNQDFTKPWTDAELYAKYNLSPEEIDFIESMIKPMDLPDDIDSEPQNA